MPLETTVFVSLIQNAALLLVLSVVLESVYLFPIRRHELRQTVFGVLIGLICVAIMARPYMLQPGLLFDTRSILISVTALTFGPAPTLIAAGIASAYRIAVGGAGVLPGIAILITSAGIGLLWRRRMYPREKAWRWFNVLGMSLLVHTVMLACMLLLPAGVRMDVIRAIVLPVLTLYPATATLLSLLLMRQQETMRLQEELRQSEERFRVLFDEAPLGYQALDGGGKILFINRQWMNIFGYTREEAVGRWFGDFLPPESDGEFRSAFEAFKACGETHSEFTVITKDQKRRYVTMEGKIRYGDTGEAEHLHCILQDVTEQRMIRESLRASEAKYGSYISNAPDAIVIVDHTGQFVEVNEAAVRISGFSRSLLLKRGIMNFIDTASLSVGTRMFQDLLEHGATRGELQYTHSSGARRWANFSAVRLTEDRFLCFMSDISERKWTTEKLLYASMHDDMTGLWNRGYFDTEAERLYTPEQMPLSVIIGDINGVKLINDSFGRVEGDRIIGRAAQLLRGFCRPGDILARTGGDEFSLILPKTDKETAVSLLERIQSVMREHNEAIANDSLHIHMALGTSTVDAAVEDFLAVVKRAENSMNQRKLLEERSSHSSIIATIKATMREKSNETEAHEERIAQLARRCGMILGLSQEDLDHLELLAELHDIGKVGISEQILNKPDKLTEAELHEMMKHPEIGERIAMATASLAPIANYILCHHERWDGSGYPRHLKGEQIPLLSRILSVVDAYDAMTQDRVYQQALSQEEALTEILSSAGTQFDPRIARIFCEEVFQTANRPADAS